MSFEIEVALTADEIEAVLTEELVRRLQHPGGRKWREFGLVLHAVVHVAPFVTIAGISYALTFLLRRPWKYVAATIVGCGLVLGLASALRAWAAYLRKAQASMASLEANRVRSASATRYQFADDGIRLETQLGHSFTKWSAFRKLSQVDDFWLLYWDHEHYFIFPIQRFNAEAAKFIMRKCRENGIPVQTEWSED